MEGFYPAGILLSPVICVDAFGLLGMSFIFLYLRVIQSSALSQCETLNNLLHFSSLVDLIMHIN